MKKILLTACLFFGFILFLFAAETRDSMKFRKFDDFFIFPSIGYNDNDRFMFGIRLQDIDSTHRLNFSSHTFYSIEGHLTALADISFRLTKTKSGISIVPGLQFQRFSWFRNKRLDYNLLYNRLSPMLTFYFPQSNKEDVKKLVLKSSFISEGFALFSGIDQYTINPQHSRLFRLGYYDHKVKENFATTFWAELDQFDYQTALAENNNFLKLTAAYAYEWSVSPKSNVGFRIWASAFLKNSQRTSGSFSNAFTKGSTALIHQGHNDYAYDEIFLARNNIDGVFVNQFSMHGGGFKTPHTLSYDLGQSNHLSFAINTFMEAPFTVFKAKPILFADFGGFSRYSNGKYSNNYLYSVGIGLKSRKNNAGIYLPLINSKEINNNFSINKYNFLERLSINLSINPFY